METFTPDGFPHAFKVTHGRFGEAQTDWLRTDVEIGKGVTELKFVFYETKTKLALRVYEMHHRLKSWGKPRYYTTKEGRMDKVKQIADVYGVLPPEDQPFRYPHAAAPGY